MGGGPCAWAAEDHLRAGLRLYATPSAAQTFDDDLNRVAAMGVRVVEPDQADRLDQVRRVQTGDLQLEAIRRALGAFDVPLEVDALAVAVFDHGAAPPGYSDRRFRFDYLEERLRQDQGLAGFAFWRDEIPARFTRLQAVAKAADLDVPVLVMDTGPAAVLGALEDPQVRGRESTLVVNVGNFHTLAFHLADGEIAGVFEHHTGELTRERLADYLLRLGDGTLTNQEVFDDMGHGALVLRRPTASPDLVAVTGPRRSLIRGADLPIYQAVPHGDMMLAGCFGLIRAFAYKDPVHGEEIAAALDGIGEGRALW